MNILRRVVKVRDHASELVNKITLPERFRGTVVENWARYWRGLLTDYGDVFRDTAQTARSRPKRTAAYAALLSTIAAAIRLNPPEHAYRAAVIQNRDEVTLVAPAVRNPATLDYLHNLEKLHNESRVRHVSLGVLSLYWVADQSERSGLPRAQCVFLRPAWLSWHSRIIEVAFWNKFWALERNLVDFDINPAEWATLH